MHHWAAPSCEKLTLSIEVAVLVRFFLFENYLLGRAQPVIQPNLYSIIDNFYEHNSLGSSGKELLPIYNLISDCLCKKKNLKKNNLVPYH